MISADDFIARARTWVGVPFHHQGRSRAGVDCIGLVLAILAEAELLPDEVARERPNYGRLPTDRLLAGVERWCVRCEEPRPGCLLLIRWPRMKVPSHVAIYTGSSMIHAYRTSRTVVEHAYRAQWVRQTDSAWLLPGITYG